MRAYQAHIIAERGTFLIGGVPHHSSHSFETREQADAWLQTIVASNRRARRHIADASVVEVDCPNPIMESETA